MKDDEDKAFKELMKFLAPRIESARRGKLCRFSMDKIIAKAKSQRHSRARGPNKMSLNILDI